MENPKPFCLNKKTIKAFVLGADPTNFTDNGKQKQLEFVFGILSDETKYFSGILKNLNQAGLHLEDVYVQNAIPEYLESETEKNEEWEKHAEKWLPDLKAEFDQINPNRKKPVLVTAEKIMKFLVNDNYKLPSANFIYSDDAKTFFYVKPKENKLNRPLMAFYRHQKYRLDRNKVYSGMILDALN